MILLWGYQVLTITTTATNFAVVDIVMGSQNFSSQKFWEPLTITTTATNFAVDAVRSMTNLVPYLCCYYMLF